ncbi:Matrix metalloproteinase-21 [Nymphaea thermarum]|nr:Matrix metalloproteinase-21 [Nymphaea thermarum]
MLFLQMPKMVSTLSFVAILMLLVQTNCMEWASGHNGNFHYQAGAEFLQLSGYRRGQSHEVLPSLKRYLQHFGYLDMVADTRISRVFDEDLEAALKKYQLFFSLNATGVLDTATVHQLIQKRCGVPDIIKDLAPAKFHRINVTGNSSSSLYSLGNKRWPPSSMRLLYDISENEHMPFPIADLRPVIREAFETWALYSPFDFTETSIDRNAQLHVGFYKGRHLNCPIPFEGPNDMLAHGFYPRSGKLHINADIIWAIDPEILKDTENSYDVQSVALHEIGHVLGLRHSAVPEAIMYPSLDSQTRKVDLHGDDIAGINAITFIVAILVLVCLHGASCRMLAADAGKESNGRADLRQLIGCRRGQNQAGLASLKRYLNHFGYLDSEGADEFSDEFNEDLEAALRTYQLNFNLNTSGVLDEPTVQKLIQPRCGVSDIVNGTNLMKSGRHRYIPGVGHFVMHYTFFDNMPRWPDSQRNLKYTFSTNNQQYGAEQLRSVFSAVFAKWAAVSPFQFAEASEGELADLDLAFYSGDHGDGSPFDGPGTVLAHAFAPTN